MSWHSQQARELQELESLVEVKIYREDELEREIETLKAARKHASSSTATVSNAPPRPQSTTSMSAASSTSHMRCELCEGDDHELEDCQIMNPDPETLDQAGSSDSPLAHRMGNSVIRGGGKVQCDDCGVSPFFGSIGLC
jgi:hypothetical protein